MITARKIWNVLNTNEQFQNMPDPMKRIWRQIIERMLRAANYDLLITTQRVCEMRVAFLDTLVEGGFIRQIVNAFCEVGSERDVLMIALADRITSRREKLTRDTTLTILGRSDKVHQELLYMLGSNVALRGAARKAYERGELTIGMLLMLQPTVLIPDHLFEFKQA